MRMSESLIEKAQKLLEALKLGLVEQPEVKVGITPHEVVFTENKLRLLHYIPLAEKVFPIPLVMIFALVNRPYILDLQPGRSVVEVLLRGGIDVYMIDWGIPGGEDKHQNLDFYINKYIRKVVNKVKKISGSDKILVENFLAMEKWLNDNIPVAGEVFREFIKYCYQENLLVQNKLKIKGRVVDLRKIKCPVLNLIAEKDHLVPPATSIVLENLISSKDKETILFPTGHIGLSVSSKSLKELWPKVARWLAKRSN